jgi:hypothetical protein
LCDSMARIFRAVYGVEDTAQSPFYRRLHEQAQRWPDARMRFRV